MYNVNSSIEVIHTIVYTVMGADGVIHGGTHIRGHTHRLIFDTAAALAHSDSDTVIVVWNFRLTKQNVHNNLQHARSSTTQYCRVCLCTKFYHHCMHMIVT